MNVHFKKKIGKSILTGTKQVVILRNRLQEWPLQGRQQYVYNFLTFLLIITFT